MDQITIYHHLCVVVLSKFVCILVISLWCRCPSLPGKKSPGAAMGPANSAVERSEDDVMQLDGKVRQSAIGISTPPFGVFLLVGWLGEFSE